ncbi:hypothetical protein NSTCB13_00840 [Nostoc sp. DSM 114160]
MYRALAKASTGRDCQIVNGAVEDLLHQKNQGYINYKLLTFWQMSIIASFKGAY